MDPKITMTIPEIPEQTFQLLMRELDTIKTQNATQLEFLTEHMKHVKVDMELAKTVARHSGYFKVIGVGISLVFASIAAKMGWK